MLFKVGYPFSRSHHDQRITISNGRNWINSTYSKKDYKLILKLSRVISVRRFHPDNLDIYLHDINIEKNIEALNEEV